MSSLSSQKDRFNIRRRAIAFQDYTFEEENPSSEEEDFTSTEKLLLAYYPQIEEVF